MAITKISTPELFDFSATNTALQLPTGDTASRPATPSTGEWRFNSELKYVEFWDSTAWRQIDTESSAVFTPSENFNTNTYFGTGAAQVIDAKFNEAANFNGTSSVISIPLNVVSVSSAYTLSLWFNAVDVSANTGIFTNQGNSPIIGQIGINIISSTQINLYSITTNGSNTVDSLAATVPTMSANNWYNLVVVADRSLSNKGKIYLNGVEASSYTFNAGVGSNALYSTAQIGRSDNRFTKGKIDQVRIFNTSLTDAQAEDLYTDETTTTAATLDFPSGAGCIAAYQLDGDASDLSGTYGGAETNIGYTGLKFTPDFVWVKQRSSPARGHILSNSMSSSSSANSLAFMSSQNAEREYTGAEANGAYIRTLDSNGFSVGSSNFTGASGEDYVAWCWKAAASTTTIPASGSQISSDVRANVDAGFSIVEATSPSSGVFTVGHGLNAAPELYIIKNKASAGGWLTYVKLLGANKYLQLNDSGAAGTSTRFWDNTLATPTVFTMESGYVITPNVDFSALCWHSVSGYQKVGSYTGSNPNTKTVYTTDNGLAGGANGFKPSFLMIKDSSTSGEDWIIVDNKREGASAPTKVLYPSNANIEDSYTVITFTSNGFTVGQTGLANGNGSTIIYLAIA